MDKVKEYRDYILEHCNNVKKAFQVYGELLCNELGLNLQDMQNQINEHDESEWSTEEFELYRMKFFPNPGEEISDFNFNVAWLHHIHYNPHHPQHWIYYNEDNNSVSVYPMPNNYILEMICDWIAMGYKFNEKAYDYYNNKGKNKLFNNNTRRKLEYLLNKIKEFDKENNIL